MMAKQKAERCYGRYCVAITSPDRVLFPASKITKADLIDYYEAIAPVMLPYMKDRLLTMQRFPEGIQGESFYQKDVPDYFPSFIKRVVVPKQEGGVVHYMVCDKQATLVYLANSACITPHLFLSKVDKLHYPDQMIFDLDPSQGHDFEAIKKVALLLKQLLEDDGLVPFVKTTGSRGLHVQVPLRRSAHFDQVRAYAYTIAEKIVTEYPKQTTLETRKTARGKKIFIDVLRNSFGATAVSPYAVRAHEHAPVATPLEWHELGEKKLLSTTYTINNIFKRLQEMGDPWHGISKSAKLIKTI
jgi:bifunctional non-homologous end joining protein LigD